MEVSSAHICRPDLDAKAFIPDFTVKEKFESNSGAGGAKTHGKPIRHLQMSREAHKNP
jgi:hypothetical protein